jgi:hypothetical protein
MNSKNFYSEFSEKLNVWKKMLGKSNNFVKIYNEYINNPEGYILINKIYFYCIRIYEWKFITRLY